MNKLNAVSLFSNCGAGDVGYMNAGFDFKVLAEIDPKRLDVALSNHKNAIGVEGDLRDTWPQVVDTYKKNFPNESLKLLAACPPCQGMSSARSNRGYENDPDAGSRDERNLLVTVIEKVANSLNPELIVVENVQAFLTKKIWHPYKKEAISASSFLIEMLAENYRVYPFLVDLSDFGVPQTRIRTFLTFINRKMNNGYGFLDKDRAPFPRPTHTLDLNGKNKVTVNQALRSFGLPSLDAKSQKTASAKHVDKLHFVPVWAEDQYKMVEAIPINSGKSAWENNSCPECKIDRIDEEQATCPNCGTTLLRPIVNDKGELRLVRGFRNSSYRRMYPDKPASTITTASGHIGSSFNIHPFENRVLSAKECALLQTFPESFEWNNALEKYGHSNIRKMIGEAVPPLFTELHGKALVGVLTGNWSLAPISIHDERITKPFDKLKIGTDYYL